MGLTQILSTALDGLTAQSYGLSTTGDNISNVNTPGYARREAQFETRGLGLTGVNVVGLRRISDAVIERRQYQASGMAAAASERDGQLANVESIFDDSSGAGLADVLAAFYSSFSALASNPSDPTARASVLARAETLTGRINGAADSIASQRADLLTKAQQTTAEVNQRAQKIADLNSKIAAAKAQGQETANLEDQRAKVLLDLTSFIDVTTVTQDNGSILVQASGATLVDDLHARTLTVDLNSNGDIRLLSSVGGGTGTDITRFLSGGSLAGIKEARDVDLVAIGNQLDNLAYGIATTVNTQHMAGYGLDGVGSRALFAISPTSVGAGRAIKVSSDVAGNPSAIAASGNPLSGPGNSDNAVLLAQLAVQPAVGTRSAAAAYGDLIGDVGSRKAAAADDLAMRQSVADQATAMRESASGVSLDEEMVALSKYQRAYEASSKLIATVDQLLQELMDRVGR